MSELRVLSKISIGGLTKESLIQRLVDAGIQLNNYARTLFEHPSFCPQSRIESVTLVKVTLSDLQLKSPCSFEEIVHRASVAGLESCPMYLGAFFRLEYLDQPEGPYLTIVS